MSKKKDSSKLLSVGILAASGYFLLKGNNTKKTTTDTTASDDSGKSSDDTTSGDGNDIHTVKSAAYRGDPNKEYDPFYDYDDDEELSDIFHQDARYANISSKSKSGIRIRIKDFKLYASRFHFNILNYPMMGIDKYWFYASAIMPFINEVEIFNPFGTPLILDKIEIKRMEINGVVYGPHFSYHGNIMRRLLFPKLDFFKDNKINTTDDSYINVSSMVDDTKYDKKGNSIFGNYNAFNFAYNCMMKFIKVLPVELPAKSSPDSITLAWITNYMMFPKCFAFFVPLAKRVKSKSEVIMDDLQSIKYIKIECWLTIDNMPAIQKNIIIKRKGAEGVTCDEDEWISEFDDSKFLLNMVD
jgi:hypothetical protein